MAINFPHSPSINETHTHSGKEWKWNGSSWILSTNASNYTLPIATAIALGGVKIGDRLTIDSSTGVLDADVQTSTYGNSDVDTHLNQSNPTSGYVLSWNGTDYAWVEQTAAGASVSVSDTAPSTPSNGDLWFKSDEAVLKVRYEDGSSNQWVDAVPMGLGSGGTSNFTGLSDTPSSLTADKWLKVNAGGTALEYTDAPTGGASVTVSDNAPASPTAGDLWWDSDDGRLKVYYTDATPDSQWVDASPLGSPTLSVGNTSIAITDTGSNGNIAFNTDGTDRWKITSGGHIIPYTNAAFDIGNAEYKVRHLFLSDNSLKFIDDNDVEHALSVSSNKLHYEGKEVLANCVFTGLDNNHTIKYNGTNWVNAAAEAPSAPAFQSNWRIPL